MITTGLTLAESHIVRLEVPGAEVFWLTLAAIGLAAGRSRLGRLPN